MNAQDLSKQIEILSKALERNTELVENNIQQVSALGSDLKAFKFEQKHFQERVESYMTENQPVIDFVRTLNSLNKFFKWCGLTIVGVIALLYAMVKKS